MEESKMVGKFKWLAVILVCFSLVFVFSGCSTPGGRSAGDVIDDGTITTKVKTKLFADSILKGFSIDVDCFQGEVTLTGAVKTPREKERAEDIARKTLGVRRVNNLLKIQ
jgi:hyperosmotically inducible protein